LACKKLKIDLHIHSSASDGTLPPARIIEVADQLELSAISITDHDTLEGAKEAIRIGIPEHIKFLTGVEISATPPPSFRVSGSFHVLGYGIRLDDPGLNQTLKVLQTARENRAPRILERLESLGISLTLADVLKAAGNGQIGRPHIARVLVEKKVVKSINEAFGMYLGRVKPAYVDKYRIGSDETLRMIKDAGGIPVLAHPILLKIREKTILENLIGVLTEMGLKGIEVFYPEHSEEDQRYYAGLAKRYGLLMTGGSDFHGSLKPDIQMGSGRGDLSVPYEIYENLVRAVRN